MCLLEIGRELAEVELVHSPSSALCDRMFVVFAM